MWDIVLHVHKQNHLWVFSNVGKIAFCCSSSRDKEGYFVLTVGIRKAPFIPPGGNEKRPKLFKLVLQKGHLHIPG